MRLSDLWSWKGTIDRGDYARWGLSLLAVKWALDAAVSWYGFGRPWDPSVYLMPPFYFYVLEERDHVWLLTLLAVSLPFFHTGVALTVRRLRSLEWPLALVVVFAIPFMNLFLFILLTTVKGSRPFRGRSASEAEAAARGRGFLNRVLKSPTASALAAVVLWVPLCLGMVLLLDFGASYGCGLFVLFPFTLGMTSAVVWNWRAPRSASSTVGVILMACSTAVASLLATGLEGAICLTMAFPLVVPIALVGALAGQALARQRHERSRPAGRIAAGAVLAMPLLAGLEGFALPEPPVLRVESRIVVDAPREAVWPHVVGFPEIPPPRELLFRAGVAYPVRATIEGHGHDAVRRCVFSTGAFVEPIEIWREPELLEFSVVESPPPMRELSPFAEVVTPHLEDGFTAVRGRFRLEEGPDGSTLLEGTTWYRQELWPQAYWRLWSDHIIGLIHLRVLRHIKEQAEAGRHEVPGEGAYPPGGGR